MGRAGARVSTPIKCTHSHRSRFPRLGKALDPSSRYGCDCTSAKPKRMNDAKQNPSTVRVWDLPTRLFHWALALTIVGSVVSAKIGGNAMVWHFRFGYVVFGLVAFRVLWGLVGGRW